MCVRLREHFNIAVNGVVRESDGKDQSKTHKYTANGPLNVDLESVWKYR